MVSSEWRQEVETVRVGVDDANNNLTEENQLPEFRRILEIRGAFNVPFHGAINRWSTFESMDFWFMNTRSLFFVRRAPVPSAGALTYLPTYRSHKKIDCGDKFQRAFD